MRIHRLLPFALIALGALSLGSGCPTIPKLEDRVVELAFGGSTTLPPFTGASNANTHFTDSNSYDLSTDIDLDQLLQDSDVDVENVTGIKLDKVEYRVSTGNGRSLTISNGHVTVQQVGVDPAGVTLVTGFSQNVTSTTPFIRGPLTPAGVDVLNRVLEEVRVAARAHTTPAHPTIAYTVSGDASSVPYLFQWELKISVTVSGTIDKVKVFTGS